MDDTGHHWVGLCPKQRHRSWFGGCPRVEARRVLPTIDETSIMYELELMHNRERQREFRVGEQLSHSQSYG